MTSYNLIKLNLARNCLRHIIRTYNIKEIFVPYYICKTVITAIRKEKCKIKFYNINKNFYPQETFPQDAYILYPNYFGICALQVVELSQIYKNLIVDNAHNFFMPDVGLASFNSLRKFFNLKDGAFLKISSQTNFQYETDNFHYKQFKKLTYEDLVSNELRLNKEDIKLISPITENYFSQINLNEEKIKRLKNFKKLHERFHSENELPIFLTSYDVPFVYPYLTHKEGEAQKLEQEGFLILRYWDYLPESFPEYDFYRYLIPIPLS